MEELEEKEQEGNYLQPEHLYKTAHPTQRLIIFSNIKIDQKRPRISKLLQIIPNGKVLPISEDKMSMPSSFYACL